MKHIRIHYKWIPVILWMGLIFYLSHQDASHSSELSSGVMLTLLNLLSGMFRFLEIDPSSLHFFIRKGAHFSAYLVLGLLSAHAANPKDRKRYLFVLVLCAAYAVSDEYHQTFIPGRSGEWRDVLIDITGSFVGISAYSLYRKVADTGIHLKLTRKVA